MRSKNKAVVVSRDRTKRRTSAVRHRRAVNSIRAVFAEIVLDERWKAACPNRGDDASDAAADVRQFEAGDILPLSGKTIRAALRPGIATIVR